jgi:hypothetical protein
VENCIFGKTFSYFAGSHDGYSRLDDPVTHARYVVKINGGPALVRDVALGDKEHDLEVLWHLAPDLKIREMGKNLIVASHAADDGANLSMVIPDETGWQMEISRGLTSPAYGKYVPAPLVRIRARRSLPTELATVLWPYATALRRFGHLVSLRQAAVQVYELADADTNQGFCFALDKRPWNFGPWFSDAEFLYCRIEAEKLLHLIMVGGTYVAWQGQELIKAPGPSAFFEWRKQDAVLHAEPNQFSGSPLFQKLTGGAVLRTESSNPPSTYAEKH